MTSWYLSHLYDTVQVQCGNLAIAVRGGGGSGGHTLIQRAYNHSASFYPKTTKMTCNNHTIILSWKDF